MLNCGEMLQNTRLKCTVGRISARKLLQNKIYLSDIGNTPIKVNFPCNICLQVKVFGEMYLTEYIRIYFISYTDNTISVMGLPNKFNVSSRFSLQDREINSLSVLQDQCCEIIIQRKVNGELSLGDSKAISSHAYGDLPVKI